MVKLPKLMKDIPPNFTVFLSHSISDKKLLKFIYEKSTEAGINLYIAERQPEYERTIIEKIEQRLDKSRCVLVLYTKEASQSPFVNMEIGRAAAKGKPMVTLLEKGLKLSGWLYGHESILFSSNKPRQSFKKAFDYINNRSYDWSLAEKEGEIKEKILFGVNFGLPELPGEFIDRKKEIEKIASILEEGRIVIIKGLCGIGKTCIAIKAANSLDNIEKDSVYFLKGRIIRLIMACDDNPRNEFLAWLSQIFNSLLILDDFAMLDNTDRSRILKALHPDNKIIITADDIQISDVNEKTYLLIRPLQKRESIKLFEKLLRSAGIVLAKGMSQKICQHLEGFPVAIKFTASQICAGYPTDLIEQNLMKSKLKPFFALLNQSYRALDSRAKSLLLKLSLLSSTFPLSFIHKLVGKNMDTLADLSLKGFVRIQGGRCELYKIIREFALSKINRSKKVKYEEEIKPLILKEIKELLWREPKIPEKDKNELLVFLPILPCEVLFDLMDIFMRRPGLITEFHKDFMLRLEILVSSGSRSEELWDKLIIQEEEMLKKEEELL